MVPDLLVLALDYYRAPLRFSDLADPHRPLPESFENLVGAFGSALSPRNIESISQAVGMSPEEVGKASRFFLRQVLLSAGSSHYRVLGVTRNASDEAIHQHYQLLVRIFHPDRSVDETGRDVAYTARINEAYNVLKKPAARRKYDRQLRSTPGRREGESRAGEPRRPPVSIRPFTIGGEPETRFPFRWRRMRLLAVLGGVAAVLLAALAIMLANRPPLLRANPELADESMASPAFLRERPSRPIRNSDPDDIDRLSSRDAGNSEEAEPPRVGAGTDVQTAAASPSQPEGIDLLEKEKIREKARRSVVQSGAVPIQDDTSPTRSGSTDVEPGAADNSERGKEQLSNGTPMPAESVTPDSKASGASGGDHGARATLEDVRPERHARTAPPDPLPEEAVKHATRDLNRKDEKSVTDSIKGDRRAPPQTENAIPSREADHRKRGETASSIPTPEASSRPKARPEDTVARLTHYYQTGNLNGFVGLFTADARVTDGSGTGFIRADYARFFAKAPERRLAINNLRWQSTADGKLTGRGAYRASINDSQTDTWRYSSGELLIELVPWMSGYKISKMIHR